MDRIYLADSLEYTHHWAVALVRLVFLLAENSKKCLVPLGAELATTANLYFWLLISVL